MSSDSFIIDSDPVLLYKSINGWYGSLSEESNRFCGSRLKYVNEKDSRVGHDGGVFRGLPMEANSKKSFCPITPEADKSRLGRINIGVETSRMFSTTVRLSAGFGSDASLFVSYSSGRSRTNIQDVGSLPIQKILIFFKVSDEMNKLEEIVQRVQKTKHGFLDIKKAAEELLVVLSKKEALKSAKNLYESEIHQVRCLAVFMLGHLAGGSKEAMAFLKKKVSRDPDWRVQEILAKAFDSYCSDTGYEKTLPVIEEWLASSSPNVRRAVTEGLRIWTGRPFFKEHPDIAVQMLRRLREDESAYVRKSVGNALRDISKKHQELVENELKQWDTGNRRILQTYTLAVRHLQK